MKSDENQPYDPMENWLRQTLGDYRPEAPADAWQRLAPHLPQRKRRRPAGFWVSWSVAGTAVVVVLLWSLKSAAPSVALPVVVKNESPIAQAMATAFSNNLVKKESAVLEGKSAAMTVKPFAKNHFLRKNSPKSTTSLFRNLTDTVPTEVHFMKMETRVGFGFLEKTSSPQAKDRLEKLPVKTLNLLPLAKNHQPEFQFTAVPVLPPKAKSQRFWLGIEAAPSLLMPKNMGKMPGGLAFPETHLRPGNGWQTGLSLAFEPLKNWRVAVGIQHVRQMHEAQHAATLRLMDGVCLNPHAPGLKEYQFQYSVVSGGEENELTLRLQQQDIGSTMPDDEPFALKMKTAHRLAAWRVPLSIERRFGTRKWQGFVRGGAVVDFSEKSEIEVTHFTEVCQDLCFQNGHVPSVQTSAQADASVGWLAGAGIERQVSRRAALRFEPFMVGQKGSIQYGLGLGLLFSH